MTLYKEGRSRIPNTLLLKTKLWFSRTQGSTTVLVLLVSCSVSKWLNWNRGEWRRNGLLTFVRITFAANMKHTIRIKVAGINKTIELLQWFNCFTRRGSQITILSYSTLKQSELLIQQTVTSLGKYDPTEESKTNPNFPLSHISYVHVMSKTGT